MASPITSCHVMSCHVMSCHVMSHILQPHCLSVALSLQLMAHWKAIRGCGYSEEHVVVVILTQTRVGNGACIMVNI